MVVGEDLGQLRWDRHGPCGLLGLGGGDLAVAVNLMGELDFGVVQRVKMEVGPGQPE